MFYVLVSKAIVTVEEERKDEIPMDFEAKFSTLAEAIAHFDTNEQRFIADKFKHIKILDHAGNEHLYYYAYKWLPKSKTIRLNPPPDELTDLVKYKPGVHYRPNLHQLVQQH